MNKLVKGLIIGGAIGAGAMAVRAYKRDEETEGARDDILRGAAVGAAAGAALGLLGELTPKAVTAIGKREDLKKNFRRMKSRAKTARFTSRNVRRVTKRVKKKLSMLEWGQILAAATPVMHTVVEVAKSRAEAAMHHDARKKKAKSKKPSASRPDSVVIPGPLGRVRLSTMHFGETLTNRAARTRTRVRTVRRGQPHNGSH